MGNFRPHQVLRESADDMTPAASAASAHVAHHAGRGHRQRRV